MWFSAPSPETSAGARLTKRGAPAAEAPLPGEGAGQDTRGRVRSPDRAANGIVPAQSMSRKSASAGEEPRIARIYTDFQEPNPRKSAHSVVISEFRS